MTEKEDGSEEKVIQARIKLEALQVLRRSQGWDILQAIIKTQCKQLEVQILHTPVTAEKVYEQEFNKGHRNGLEIAVKLLDHLIDELTAELEAVETDQEDDNDAS